MCVCVYVCVYIYIYIYICVYVYIYIHTYILKVDKENRIKQVREKYFLCHLFIEKNDPVLHICALQKCVNLLD